MKYTRPRGLVFLYELPLLPSNPQVASALLTIDEYSELTKLKGPDVAESVLFGLFS